MMQTIAKIVKWASIPALIVVALLPGLAGRYEGLMNLTICLIAVVFVQRAAGVKNYGWAVVCVVVAVAFSPLFLVAKMFLLMGLTCIAACVTIFAAFRPRPVAAL